MQSTRMVNGIPSLEQELRTGAEQVVSQQGLLSYQLDMITDGDEVVKYILTFEHEPEREITVEDLELYRIILEFEVKENGPLERDLLDITSAAISG